MALINCSECGAEISDKATVCPHCGAPVTKKLSKGDVVPYSDSEVSVLLSKKKSTSHILHLILSILTAGIWVFIWLLVAVSNANENAKIDRKIKKGKKLTSRDVSSSDAGGGWI